MALEKGGEFALDHLRWAEAGASINDEGFVGRDAAAEDDRRGIRFTSRVMARANNCVRVVGQ